MRAWALCLLAASAGCGARQEDEMTDRALLEAVLEAQLPSSVTRVRLVYEARRDGPDFFQVNARLDGDATTFAAVVAALGLARRGEPAAGGRLPTAWALPTGAQAAWWGSTAVTPADAAARDFGAAGWIVAKAEGGAVYLIVTDAGPEARVPRALTR